MGAPETWTPSDNPGQEGSVTVLFGDCNTFNGTGKPLPVTAGRIHNRYRLAFAPATVPTTFQNTCCGMAGEQTVGAGPQQCSPRVQAPVPVARFQGRASTAMTFRKRYGKSHLEPMLPDLTPCHSGTGRRHAYCDFRSAMYRGLLQSGRVSQAAQPSACATY